MKPNGCGPKWVPRWIKKYVLNVYFETECNKHDSDYTVGGSEEDRLKADKDFDDAMSSKIKTLHPLAKIPARVMASTFNGFVKVFGKHFFTYK